MSDDDASFELGPPPPVFTPGHAPAAKAKAAAATSSHGSTTYTVKSGDTLGQIAERHHTTVSEILKANPQISNPNSISVGQHIKLPGKSSGHSGGHSSGHSGGASPKPPPKKPRPPASHDPKPDKHDHKAEHKLIFPLWIKPSASWKDGARYFGAPRSGRLHAGCDLLAPFKSKIRAIADGVIIRPPYFFYDGTNALEVFHPGIGVVRYGEISSSKVVPWRAGQKVKCGELIAYVGLLDSLGWSMIHFELYGESARGQALTQMRGPYMRHPALKNPTKLVDKLFRLTF